MNTSAANSALDVAYWFMDKNIETQKLQHLLFLTQAHYAISNDMQYFMPCIFICDETGFAEPSVAKIAHLGKPLGASGNIDSRAESFLAEIWDTYGKLSLKELDALIKNSPVYKKIYREGMKSIVQIKSVVENFKPNSNIFGMEKKKVTFSQNGPVVIMPWKPRNLKLEIGNQKGISYE